MAKYGDLESQNAEYACAQKLNCLADSPRGWKDGKAGAIALASKACLRD